MNFPRLCLSNSSQTLKNTHYCNCNTSINFTDWQSDNCIFLERKRARWGSGMTDKKLIAKPNWRQRKNYLLLRALWTFLLMFSFVEFKPPSGLFFWIAFRVIVLLQFTIPEHEFGTCIIFLGYSTCILLFNYNIIESIYINSCWNANRWLTGVY